MAAAAADDDDDDDGYKLSVPPRPNATHKRLLPILVDEIAAAEPQCTWVEMPIEATTYKAGFRPITWKELANAVNGLAHLLASSLGPSPNFETLAYMGPSDPRYPMMILAGIKTGYKVFLDSPRNSMEAHEKLFERLHCKTLVTTSPVPPSVNPLVEAFNQIKVLQIPSIDELVSTDYPHYSYNRTYEDAKHDPLFVLHTSGSTGIPKPLIYTYEYVHAAMNICDLPPPEGYESLLAYLNGTKGLLFLPPFHFAGMYYSLWMPVMFRSQMVFNLSGVPATGADIGPILEKTSVDWAMITSAHCEDIAKDPQLMDIVGEKVKLLLSGGGALPPHIGNALAARVRLKTILGSSEFSAFPQLIPNSSNWAEDWAHIELHPFIGAEFEHRKEEHRDAEHHELLIKRNKAYEDWQPVWALFPEKQVYHTNDIFRPHPTRPNTWLHQARNDDIIVFLNGEKTNPVTFECTVGKHPDVRSALVFGNQRFEAGILIELVPQKMSALNPDSREQLIASVWSYIEEANSAAPAHARISRSHIIFADTDMPFQRSVKGIAKRHGTLELYKSVIGDLYDTIESLASNKPVEKSLANGTVQYEVQNGCHNGTKGQVHGISSCVNGTNGHINDTKEHINGYNRVDEQPDELTDLTVSHSNEEETPIERAIFDSLSQTTSLYISNKDQDFFTAGLDSLQALRLARYLRSLLKRSKLEPSLIYSNPSVRALASALNPSTKNTQRTTTLPPPIPPNTTSKTFIKHAAYMEILSSCINKPTPSFSSFPQSAPPTHTVMLTGSTGSLGSYLLSHLQAHPQIAHIYTLDRRTPPSSRRPHPRTTALVGDLSDPTTLGLAPTPYATLLSSTTLIIHAAWPVDFAQSLPQFQTSLAGTTHLLCFAARAARAPTFLFLSSVAAAAGFKAGSKNNDTNNDTNNGSTSNGFDDRRRRVPACILDPSRARPVSGYGQSKLVAERLVDKAAREMGVRAGVVRLGQVAPARRRGTGVSWNGKEWFPRLLRSSRAMGCLPANLGRAADVLDWVPGDEAAEVLVELGLGLRAGDGKGGRPGGGGGGNGGAEVFNVVNPAPGSWQEVLEAVNGALGGVQVVEGREWVERLRGTGNWAGGDGGAGELDVEALEKEVEENPALPLEGFYRELFDDEFPLRMDTESACMLSGRLRDMKKVGVVDVERWVSDILQAPSGSSR